jgi:hypothetical protein
MTRSRTASSCFPCGCRRGGVIPQLFAYPSHALVELEKATGKPLNRSIRLYVIRNGRLDSEWSETPRRTVSIGGRAISALVQAEGVADVHRIFRTAVQDGADFNLAYIGADFHSVPHERFDAAYMQSLFDWLSTCTRWGAVAQGAARRGRVRQVTGLRQLSVGGISIGLYRIFTCQASRAGHVAVSGLFSSYPDICEDSPEQRSTTVVRPRVPLRNELSTSVRSRRRGNPCSPSNVQSGDSPI